MNSDCLSFNQFVAYILSEFNQEEKISFESHLSNCDRCLRKFIESDALLHDPSIDQKSASFSLPDVSPLAKWLKDQMTGFFQWRPLSDFYGFGNLALEPVRQVKSSERDSMNGIINTTNDSTAVFMKIIKDNFISHLWIEKKTDEVTIWIKIQFLDTTEFPVFIDIQKDDQLITTETLNDNDYVILENYAFGQYELRLETDEYEESIVQLEINEHQIERISK
jgi:hypothetical protein